MFRDEFSSTVLGYGVIVRFRRFPRTSAPVLEQVNRSPAAYNLQFPLGMYQMRLAWFINIYSLPEIDSIRNLEIDRRGLGSAGLHEGTYSSLRKCGRYVRPVPCQKIQSYSRSGEAHTHTHTQRHTFPHIKKEYLLDKSKRFEYDYLFTLTIMTLVYLVPHLSWFLNSYWLNSSHLPAWNKAFFFGKGNKVKIKQWPPIKKRNYSEI